METPENKTASQVDLLRNLQIAAHFDANQSLCPLLVQLAYRRDLAKAMLDSISVESTKQMEMMLEMVNKDIKRILGLD